MIFLVLLFQCSYLVWARRDLNSQSLRNTLLKRTCIPFHHAPIGRRSICKGGQPVHSSTECRRIPARHFNEKTVRGWRTVLKNRCDHAIACLPRFFPLFL